MARKWGWFSAVKKAISADDSKKDQKNHKLKTTTWSAKPADLEPALSSKLKEPTFDVAPPSPLPSLSIKKQPTFDVAPPSPLPSLSTKKEPTFDVAPPSPLPPLSSKEEPPFEVAPPPPSIGTDQEEINEQIKQDAYSVDDDATTAAVADAATADDAQATEEVVHLNEEIICRGLSPPHYLGKTNEEIAAIKIQMAFRGYMARRALHALRGWMRLKTLIQGHHVKQQAATSLRFMQALAKVQSQVRERRIRMSGDNQSPHRQLQRKHDKEPNKLQITVGEDWDDSPKSKEEVEARLLDRKEAAMRRHRARTYSSIHQQTWKKQQPPPPKTGNWTFMGSMNPDWSWRWGERWMGSRPWDERRGGSEGDRRRAQKPSRPPTPTHQHSAAVSSASGEARRRQPQRRHSIAGLSVTDNEDSVASSSGKVNYSSAASKLSALSPTRISPSASKRHSCPPQMHTLHSCS